VEKETSSASRSAKASKNLEIWASATVPIRWKAPKAASTAAEAVSHSAAGTCSNAPVSCTTTSRSPGEKAAASSVDTVAKRFPP
jgi:hypothetical protein